MKLIRKMREAVARIHAIQAADAQRVMLIEAGL